MKQSSQHAMTAIFSITVIMLALVLGLLWGTAAAAAADTAIYVNAAACPAEGAGTPEDPFCTIQSGIDAAPDGGEVRVAGGWYTGTDQVTAANGNSYTQVFIIDRKSLTVTGGYNGADWSRGTDILAYATIVNAEGSGRGATLLGRPGIDITLDRMTLTGGDYTGLGNPAGVSSKACLGTGYDCGGGLLAQNVRLTLNELFIYNNTGGRSDSSRSVQGGGAELWGLYDGSAVIDSLIIANSAAGGNGYGGGLHINGGYVRIQNSQISLNHASHDGGGLYSLYSQQVQVSGSTFSGNSADQRGGAIGALQGYCKPAVPQLSVADSRFTSNLALEGAAIGLSQPRSPIACSAELTNLIMSGNSAAADGGRAALVSASSWVGEYQLSVSHVTAADNQANAFLYVSADVGSTAMTATLKNNLVDSLSSGVVAELGAGAMTVEAAGSLFNNVTNHYLVSGSGAPVYTNVSPASGDPMLDGSYHLSPGSAAIGAGVDAGVLTDIDGQARIGVPDIGADEWVAYVMLPAVLR